jgi:hypothetical protein
VAVEPGGGRGEHELSLALWPGLIAASPCRGFGLRLRVPLGAYHDAPPELRALCEHP